MKPKTGGVAGRGVGETELTEATGDVGRFGRRGKPPSAAIRSESPRPRASVGA